jgi:hypothetical protein
MFEFGGVIGWIKEGSSEYWRRKINEFEDIDGKRKRERVNI